MTNVLWTSWLFKKIRCIFPELLREKIPKFWKNYTKTLTLPQPNFAKWLWILGFFHRPQTCWQLWKNPKPFKKFTWWPVEASKFWCNFFRILVLFFQKIGKNTKKIVKIPKKLKMNLVLCIVWYIFFSDFIIDVLIVKKIFFLNFSQF